METRYNFEKQHKKGKYHAIERILKLVDKDSFLEIGSERRSIVYDSNKDAAKAPYDGVITGFGKINGKNVGIYSQDFTILGGSLGKTHGEKIVNIIKNCIKNKFHLIGINDSGGARIQEGIHSLAGYGEIFYYNTLASGYIPQISIIAGLITGGAVYSPGLTDFVFVVDKISNMFVTGPKVVKRVTYQDVSAKDLGGAYMHSTKSGVAHFLSNNEDECFLQVKKLLNIIPHCIDNNDIELNSDENFKNLENLEYILPKENNKVYDMKSILTEIVDENSFIEVQREFAKNVIIAFGKISNKTVGIIANQPQHLAGVLDCNASDKIARFVRYCDSFNIPIITFTDVPGFLPGLNQENMGIIRHGAKILYAFSGSFGSKINIIVRKAYGGAYIAMNSKHLGADFVFAWPTAEIAVMGAEGAIEILYSEGIKKQSIQLNIKEKIDFYNTQYLNPNIACKSGYVDEIIKPSTTRSVIYNALLLLKNKIPYDKIVKKHGNIPL